MSDIKQKEVKSAVERFEDLFRTIEESRMGVSDKPLNRTELDRRSEALAIKSALWNTLSESLSEKKFTTEQISDIKRAYEFAYEAHQNRPSEPRKRFRKDTARTPYITHPVDTAHILLNEFNEKDVKTIMSALLHDTLEDTKTTYEQLSAEFGDTIADAVITLSKRGEGYYSGLLQSPAHVQRIKIADRLSNIRDTRNAEDKSFAKAYLEKTGVEFIPFVEKANVDPMIKEIFMNGYRASRSLIHE